MLPAHLKLTSPTQFRRTIKGGQRAGSRTLVVHVNDTPAEVAATGPRFGLVVSKAVGNAVVRHRTARRLRRSLSPILGKRKTPSHNMKHVVRRSNDLIQLSRENVPAAP